MGGLKLSGDKLAEKLKSFEDRNIKMLSTYIGALEKSSFECLNINCGHNWVTKFSHVSSGTGCPKCSRKLDSYKIIELIKSFIDRDIKLVSEYVGTHCKSTFECLKVSCGHEWITTITSVSSGRGCPKCSGRFIDEDTIQKRIDSLENRSIKLLSKYQGVSKHHDFECTKINCNHRWSTSWNHVYNGNKGCIKCANNKLTEAEKAVNNYRNKIRTLISNLYRSGSLNISVHKNSVYMEEILTYCQSQVSNLPKKPDDNQDWHLDHIIPVSKFNHSDIEQVKICWDPRNLQWLPAKVNISKSNKLMPEYFTQWHYQVLDKLGLSV